MKSLYIRKSTDTSDVSIFIIPAYLRAATRRERERERGGALTAGPRQNTIHPTAPIRFSLTRPAAVCAISLAGYPIRVFRYLHQVGTVNRKSGVSHARVSRVKRDERPSLSLFLSFENLSLTSNPPRRSVNHAIMFSILFDF